MQIVKHLLVATTILTGIGLNSAYGYLGSFEAADGYQPFLNEVQGYNAGQYGTSNGGPGGGPVSIPTGTGLWQNLSGIYYPNFSPSSSTSYATAHQYYDRVHHNIDGYNALVITTNSEGWAGPTLKYEYHLDSRDLNGISPTATVGSKINLSFWWCPKVPGTDEGGGLGAGTIGDVIDLVDSSGNIGFSMALIQPGTTTDYVSYKNGASYVQTAIEGYSGGYSQWDLTLDLANQTITANYLDGATGLTTNLLTDASLAANMANFTTMRFASTPGVNNDKLLSLDDFSFNVTPAPEPGGAMLLGCAGLALLFRRQRK